MDCSPAPIFPYIIVEDPATHTRGRLTEILAVPGALPLLCYVNRVDGAQHVESTAPFPPTRFLFGHPDDGLEKHYTLDGAAGLARAMHLLDGHYARWARDLARETDAGRRTGPVPSAAALRAGIADTPASPHNAGAARTSWPGRAAPPAIPGPDAAFGSGATEHLDLGLEQGFDPGMDLPPEPPTDRPWER